MDRLSEEAVDVGQEIRRLREGACLSIEQLAQRIGLDPGNLRRIEDDLISPALGTLVRICDGLGVRLGRFFDRGPRKLYSLFRSSDEKVSTHFASKSGTDFGYVYRSLGSEKRKRRMEPFLITIRAPTDPSGQPVELEELASHSGEEFLYVLEGEIEVQLEDQHFLLCPGDSIYYDATMPHRVIHRGEGSARILAVIHLARH